MNSEDLIFFSRLKDEISQKLRETFPHYPEDLSTWKGQEISNFQEDLMEKAGGRISEKWFYTHLKGNNNQLPRIDILNLLCQYCGYEDWRDFKVRNQKISKRNRHVFPWKFGVVIGLIFVVSIAIYLFPSKKKYQFCFVDEFTQEAVNPSSVEVLLIQNKESPLWLHADENSCVAIETREEKIQFIVRASYYLSDTITRVFKEDFPYEKIKLKTNEYAQMIHYFSHSRIEDWKKRRKQLDEIFADNARIYQVISTSGVGIELYNKEEFIDKLTMPLKSLKEIEVLETIYTGNRISVLKFTQLNE
ncbi:hypothetical protein [Flexithrix dorotheae]|uniref:hypothetical protein n=1 Tax=Flexithrix dorotheae TaxID=70993 RepID=UPI00037DDEA1|nr:hypothetical protein [Flexithrix dorotheae]